MNTLTDYYKSTGGTLGKTVADRFADPNFAKAASMAGYNTSNYSINANNAAANTAILNNLKVLQQSGGIQGNGGAVVTSGNQVAQDRSLMNNVNNWLSGNANNNSNPTTGNPTGGTANGTTTTTATTTPKIDANTPYQTGAFGEKKYYNQQTGQYDIQDPGTAPKTNRTSTDPIMTAYYDAVDQQNAFAEQQINSLYSAMTEARGRLNVANQDLIDRIHANFDQARKTQNDVNSRIQAGTEKFGILSGRSRYAPETQQGIEAQEMQAGIDRITALNVQEADLVAKAEAARAKDDFDILYKTWNEYNDIRTKTNTAVADLYKQSVTAQKNAQDAQLAQIKAKKESITDQIKAIDSIAPSIAQNLETLPANLRDQYIQKVADQYGVDVNQIRSSIINYQNDRTDKTKKTSSGGTGGTVSERKQYAENQAYSNTEDLLNENNFAFQVEGKSEPVQLKDDNGYITPQGFRLLNARVLRPSGISREDFIKQYPELFYTKGAEFANYGLTANEKKILLGTQE